MKRLSLLAVVTLGMSAFLTADRTAVAQNLRMGDAIEAQAASGIRKPSVKPPRIQPSRAPEPASIVLAGVGVAAVCGLSRRKKGE